MRFETLGDWLAWQETLYPRPIELGLERVARVWRALGRGPFRCPVITVAGTNGKGSCVAFIEALLMAGGHRPCAYTSPHLMRYNERVRIAGHEVENARLIEAFDRVDRARGETTLTYFEFGTLAALEVFAAAEPDVLVLEVGLGGRLDAVNILDPDVAVITSIGIDHTDWLGADRGGIAREKAGILRGGHPAVCGEPDPPPDVAATAADLRVALYRVGHEFDYRETEGGWDWIGPDHRLLALPPPAVPGGHQVRNAATALMALALVGAPLRPAEDAVRAAMNAVRLPGRLQVMPGAIEVVLDVGHNAQAAAALSEALGRMAPRPTHAVAAMLAGKDVGGMVAALAPQIDHWHVTQAHTARALARERVAEALRGAAPEAAITLWPDVAAALDGARRAVGAGGRVMVLGSFYTVAEALDAPV
ncbi:MAG: bifunctional tetrahydrofolate synthase/dihydrofolate synthase [Gammaproteobacteria bacterium]|nr:bifunctional tetrahydrofolate synthase/dihydrofolate synthase [Gammaproteobacteria bacterium]